ncbi:MAG: RsmE family RNA methyltransferase [Minisyncoccia bacterium]
MRLNRFFLNYNPKERIFRLEDKEVIHQLKNVLKLKKGEEIVIFKDDLKEARSKIIELTKNFVILEILEIKNNLIEPKKEVVFYCALLKKENFELVVQKATEIGIKKIIPLITERTIKTNINLIRLKKIAKEATEQSGRGIIPLISNPLEFKETLNLVKESFNLFFDLKGQNFNSVDLRGKNKIGVFIGPEGGWSEKERDLAKEHNFVFINLSPLTFRAETAAIIAAYLAVNKI